MSIPATIKLYLKNFATQFPVIWDRYTVTDEDYIIYGWIKRSDGQRDFVVLNLTIKDKDINGSFVTSSAKHSKRICEYMYGVEVYHNPCIPIDLNK